MRAPSTRPLECEADLGLTAPCRGVCRRSRPQACLLEHSDPHLRIDSPRVVHHGSLGNLLCVMREIRLGARARRAIPSTVDGASAFGAAPSRGKNRTSPSQHNVHSH